MIEYLTDAGHTRRHYENFPVASILLPRRLRRPVQTIYAFARNADDIADEGNAGAGQRLERLEHYERRLRAVERGEPLHDRMFVALATAVRDFNLPLAPFFDLLSAFKQDVIIRRYERFGDVLDYCRRSANPIGRLMLALFGRHDATAARWSDSICTGLQLVNFLQDIHGDFRRGRVYLAQDEMRAFGVSEDHIVRHRHDDAWAAFMTYQLNRAERMLRYGRPLGRALPGRIGAELRLTIAGGLRVVDKLRRRSGAEIRRRARLNVFDWVRILPHAI